MHHILMPPFQLPNRKAAAGWRQIEPARFFLPFAHNKEIILAAFPFPLSKSELQGRWCSFPLEYVPDRSSPGVGIAI